MNAASVLTALFNGAWQGALLCGAAYIAFRFVRTLNATTMFTVWSVLLGICLALPIANAMFAARPYVRTTMPAQQTVYTPVHHSALRERTAVLQELTPVKEEPVPVYTPSLRDRLVDLATALMQRANLLLLLLGAIAVIRLALLGREVIAMFVARRRARRITAPVDAQLSIQRSYAFAASDSLTSPCVLGFSPALIVLPEQILGAPERELLSIVLHEAEHVRRYDDVQNLMHRIVSAIAFFCPGVRIALRELALYREQICDDAAVNGVGDPVAYAMTLTGMAQWAQGRGVPVPSFVFKRKQLLHRLDTLLDRAVNHSLRTNRKFAGTAALVLIVAAAIVLRVQVPVIAQVIVEPKVAAAPVHPAAAVAAAPAAKVQPRIAAKPAALAKPAKAAKPAAAGKPAAKLLPASHQLRKIERIKTHEEHLLQLHQRTAVRTQTRTSTRTATPFAAVMPVSPSQMVASVASSSTAKDYATSYATTAPPAPRAWHDVGADALLSALEAAGMRNLSVDQLIALHDHGVRAQLITEAHAFFGSTLTAGCLVGLTDHGISALYLQSLRAAGISGISTEDVIRLRDHGVEAPFILRVRAYNARASIDDIIRLHDSGF